LQHWRALGLPLVCAALAATVGWAVAGHCCEASPGWVRMLVGGPVIFACYGALYAVTQLRRRT